MKINITYTTKKQLNPWQIKIINRTIASAEHHLIATLKNLIKLSTHENNNFHTAKEALEHFAELVNKEFPNLNKRVFLKANLEFKNDPNWKASYSVYSISISLMDNDQQAARLNELAEQAFAEVSAREDLYFHHDQFGFIDFGSDPDFTPPPTDAMPKPQHQQ
jgi:hypothetical protein